MNQSVDVVVVGAGASGLTAAAGLRERGHSVLVLEARDRIGGKILTVDVAGHPADLGAHWIGPGQDRMYATAERLGLAVEPQHLTGRSVVVASRGRRTTRSASVPPLPLRSNLELLRMGVRLQLAARRLDRERPWHGASDDRSLASTPLRTPDARHMLEVMTRTVSGAEPDEMSELAVLAYSRASTSFARLVAFKGGAQQDHLPAGMAAIVDGIAEPLRDVIRTDSPVESIEQDGDRVVVTVAGESVECRAVVVATAPRQRRDIVWQPALPADHAALNETELGAYTKVVVAFDEPFWRHEGLSGLVLGLDRTVQMVVDVGDDDVGLVAAFVTGRPARELAELDEDAKLRAVAADLVEALGPWAGREHWRAHALHEWREDPWSRGAPVTVHAPGEYAEVAPAIRRPHGRVHWAGTDSADRWAGYVEGALQAGERAAAEVDAVLRATVATG